MNKDKGAMVLSLDFELLWGVFDQVNWEEKKEYFQNTREVIPEILDLFSNYNIHATWATVGMLFNTNWEEWIKNKPTELPTYEKEELSAYSFGKRICNAGSENECFGQELIALILTKPHQEMGTHTYSHYYCLEQGQNAQQFKQDLQMAIDLGKNLNISIDSLVFPRNQLKREYLEICFELGIKNVRSNPTSWYWRDANSSNIMTKSSRTGDAYINLCKKSYSWEQVKPEPDLPVLQMASRFLRPVEKNSFLRKLKLNRILSELEHAAKRNEIYHLWWHPHNFGDRPKESLYDLEVILKKYKELKEKFEFQSLNMREVGEKNN